MNTLKKKIFTSNVSVISLCIFNKHYHSHRCLEISLVVQRINCTYFLGIHSVLLKTRANEHLLTMAIVASLTKGQQD